jgi:predicted alpha/beta superfamily hydrolase
MQGTIETLEKRWLPTLRRYRGVRVYLPFGYADSGIRYPVLYMHDGQNIFAGKTAFGGTTWNLQDEMDRMIASGFPAMIIVAIDNDSEKRFSEYAPWRSVTLDNLLSEQRLSQLGEEARGGEGFAYLDFLTQDLKPLIDTRYRTLFDKANTLLGGSSMGGYISLSAAFYQPDVFGKILAFSSAIWFNEEAMVSFITSARTNPDQKIYLDVGTDETSNPLLEAFPAIYMEGNRRIHALLKELGYDDDHLKFQIFEGHSHCERCWQARFEAALRWIMR